MIRKPAFGEFSLYSRKADPRTGKRRNLGTLQPNMHKTRTAAGKRERELQNLKRDG